MPSHRIDRINEEILRELSAIFRELKDPRIPEMTSVTNVSTTPDLKYCKVWVSVLDQRRRESAMRGIESSKSFIRRQLGQRLNLRITPQLVFVSDDSIAHGARINSIINSLNISHDEEETQDDDSQ